MRSHSRHSLFWSALFIIISLSVQSWANTTPVAGKRVLLIDSYNLDYSWSAGIVVGARDILLSEGVEMAVFSMDSKRNPDEQAIQQAALQAKKKIESWQPDLVIASDDNASKFLIEPFYKNVALPVVFCGVNWDASVYGYPYKNATGMEEVSSIVPLPKELARYAKGARLGILSGNVISDRNNVYNYIHKAAITFDKRIYVKTAEQWREAYRRLQNEVDMLIIENSMAITGWDRDEMHQFVVEYTRIPTGTTQQVMIPYVLLGFLQVPEEQGQYAAKTALRILSGEPPDSIPVVNNQQVNVTVNLDLAEKLAIVFDIDFLRNAQSYRWKH